MGSYFSSTQTEYTYSSTSNYDEQLKLEEDEKRVEQLKLKKEAREKRIAQLKLDQEEHEKRMEKWRLEREEHDKKMKELTEQLEQSKRNFSSYEASIAYVTPVKPIVSPPEEFTSKIVWEKLDTIQFDIYNKDFSAQFTFNDNTIVITKMIARGGEGRVYEGTYNGQPIIAKVTNKESTFESESSKYSYRYNSELYKLLYLSSEHCNCADIVPKVYAYFKDRGDQRVIIMEKLEPFIYLSTDSDEKHQILLQYLNRMHSHNIYHTDISAGNIMQTSSGVPKFIDMSDVESGTPFYSFSFRSNKRKNDISSLSKSLLSYKYADQINMLGQEYMKTFMENYEVLQIYAGQTAFQFVKEIYKTLKKDKSYLIGAFILLRLHVAMTKFLAAVEYLKQKKLDDPEYLYYPDTIALIEHDKEHRGPTLSPVAQELDSYIYNNIKNITTEKFVVFLKNKFGNNDPLFELALGNIDNIDNIDNTNNII